MEMEKTYRQQLLDFISDNAEKINWEREEDENYPSYKCKISGGVKLCVVSNQEGEYMEVLRSNGDYRIYEAKDYPEVIDIFKAADKKWREVKDEDFFKSVYTKVVNMYNEQF